MVIITYFLPSSGDHLPATLPHGGRSFSDCQDKTYISEHMDDIDANLTDDEVYMQRYVRGGGGGGEERRGSGCKGQCCFQS